MLKDSGQRESFSSGAVRDICDDKPRPDLISPFFIERLGKLLAEGAKKYTAYNWAKGIDIERCYQSLMRHLMYYAQGDKSEDNLAAAAANLMFMLHFEEVEKRGKKLSEKKGLINMPKFE